MIDIKVDTTEADKALRELAKDSRVTSRQLDAIVYRALVPARNDMAKVGAEITGLTQARVKRRLLISGARRPGGGVARRGRASHHWWRWAAIRTYGRAIKIHAGRLSMPKKPPKKRITVGRRKKYVFNNAFILPKEFTGGVARTGDERRVYTRLGNGQIKSANIPKSSDMSQVYRVAGPSAAESIGRDVAKGIVLQVEKNLKDRP